MPRRDRRNPQPINAARLNEMALAYVARFATSAARLDSYLRRKLRERGWADEGEPPVAAMVERYVALGYIDDAAFAGARAAGLLRRGYGARRVEQALNAAGIAADVRNRMQPGATEQRHAALALARKRRLGPFGDPPTDRAAREKQIAVLLRAGHPLDSARLLVDAAGIEAAEAWAARSEDE